MEIRVGWAAALLAIVLLAIVVFCESTLAMQDTDKPAQPNVLWLSTEDIGPQLACYGDTTATTPRLDALAAKGLTYDIAWSNYPVCAPARTTIISGMYAGSLGAGNMRSLRKASCECQNVSAVFESSRVLLHQQRQRRLQPRQTRWRLGSIRQKSRLA